MIEIKNLLARFNKILLSEEVKKTSLAEILQQTVGVRIRPKDIKIRNGTAYLNIKPIYKSEIMLKKNEILSKLEETLGKKSPRSFI